MKFCRNVYLGNRSKPREFQDHRSRVTWFSRVFLCAWCCGYPRTVLSLEQGLMILFVLQTVQKCRCRPASVYRTATTWLVYTCIDRLTELYLFAYFANDVIFTAVLCAKYVESYEGISMMMFSRTVREFPFYFANFKNVNKIREFLRILKDATNFIVYSFWRRGDHWSFSLHLAKNATLWCVKTQKCKKNKIRSVF